MSTRTFTAPTRGPVTFALTASAITVEVEVGDRYKTATIDLSGPPEIVGAARVDVQRGTWTLKLPDSRRGGRGGSVSQTAFGVVTGTVIGRVIVNGVDVTPSTGSSRATEALVAQVRLPAGSSVRTRLVAGTVTIAGTVRGVDHESTSGDLIIAAARDIDACTVSGDVRVGNAEGPVEISTTSGDIGVYVAKAVRVKARSVSGDVRVTAAPGIRADVRARSVSGQVVCR